MTASSRDQRARRKNELHERRRNSCGKREIENARGQGESLDDILPEAFALVREAAKRTLGQRPFDVQLLGGLVMHQGAVAEMMTGEGKTLAAVAPAYLNALAGKGVHVVTVNEYLARRDAVWMGRSTARSGSPSHVSCRTRRSSMIRSIKSRRRK